MLSTIEGSVSYIVIVVPYCYIVTDSKKLLTA